MTQEEKIKLICELTAKLMQGHKTNGKEKAQEKIHWNMTIAGMILKESQRRCVDDKNLSDKN